MVKLCHQKLNYGIKWLQVNIFYKYNYGNKRPLTSTQIKENYYKKLEKKIYFWYKYMEKWLYSKKDFTRFLGAHDKEIWKVYDFIKHEYLLLSSGSSDKPITENAEDVGLCGL